MIRDQPELKAAGAPFCPDRETLRIRLRADLKVYLDAVTDLERNNVEQDFEKAHKLANRARLAYEVARRKFNQHIASHGCVLR
jgi:hypothetical protein